ncbi:prestin-like isoform X2 [Macrobrachium nipponense]|uniref:prestin-like isoform X2 n=1 Tax=Macrobrachium nipponense TaxID=159736 RepID=UPI0030C8D368
MNRHYAWRFRKYSYSKMTSREDTDEEVEENLLVSEAPQHFTAVLSGMGGDEPPAHNGPNNPNNEICVSRPALNISQRCMNYHYDKGEQLSFLESAKKKIVGSCACSGNCVKSTIAGRLPILSWLPTYSFKNDLMGDAVAGVTVAIMHIPQGMAYALLGGLPPIIGIYMAFFPVLVYVFLGTSRHCSMGTFAVICLMTGKVVSELATDEKTIEAMNNQTLLGENITNTKPVYSVHQVAALVSFMVGVWEVILGMLQLGVLCVFLSDMLVSGFTTGAAVHVLTSQVKYLFGIKVPRYNGPLKIIYTYRDIISQILSSNPAAMVVSGLTITVLVFNNEILKPIVRKRTIIPIPIELICVIAGTTASYFGNLHGTYDLLIVGDIPTGLPEPTAPPFALLPRVLVDTFIITIVSYTISFSMAKIFAKKHNYEVNATQELYAQGLSNVFGSFFSCAPISASLSRSLIQESVGGVTQLTSLISCVILVFVLLFIGPVFENLPNCVLSSIIVVALKGMFLQFNELKNIWKVSRIDASIWIVSFLSVVIIDIDFGLMLGIIMSLLVLLLRSQKPSIARLGRVPNTDLYLDVHKYSAAIDVPSVVIFQFTGPLHFANSEHFRSSLFSVSGLTPSFIIANRVIRQQSASEPDLSSQSNGELNLAVPSGDTITEKQRNGVAKLIKSKLHTLKTKQVALNIPDVQWLIIDMSGISYIDSTGAKVLSQINKEYKDAGITLILAGTTENVIDALEQCGTLKSITAEKVFHTVHDAVTVISNDSLNNCTRL